MQPLKSMTLKHARVFFIFTLFLCSIASCEKDDICVDGDTPLLVIRFYDIQDTAVTKPASGLRVIGIGQGDPVNTFSDRSDTDSIAIPLRITGEETSFVFILDSADEEEVETGNRDTLRFSYSPEEVFISRACGYVMNFNGLEASASASDTVPWVQQIQVVAPDVTNQLSPHVKIFH